MTRSFSSLEDSPGIYGNTMLLLLKIVHDTINSNKCAIYSNTYDNNDVRSPFNRANSKGSPTHAGTRYSSAG